MMSIDELGEGDANKKPKTAGQVIFWIVLMNLVFSFDSILSAMALTRVFAVMTTAIVIGGVLMIWLADRVSTFLQRNRYVRGTRTLCTLCCRYYVNYRRWAFSSLGDCW